MKSLLATTTLALALMAVPGTAMAATADGPEQGAICLTSPQINSFESVCSGAAPQRAQGYFDLTEESSESPSSPRDYSAWPVTALVIALALGIAGVGSGISYNDLRARV